jgi:hypothetical protein
LKHSPHLQRFRHAFKMLGLREKLLGMRVHRCEQPLVHLARFLQNFGLRKMLLPPLVLLVALFKIHAFRPIGR